jgi:hypothetical protein
VLPSLAQALTQHFAGEARDAHATLGGVGLQPARGPLIRR